MVQNNFALASFVSAWLLFVCISATTKEKCLETCDLYREAYKYAPDHDEIVSTCEKSCDDGPTTKPTTATSSKKPMSSGAKDKAMSLDQCERNCGRQMATLKARGTLSTDMIEKVYLSCKTACLEGIGSTPNDKSRCFSWAMQLAAMYTSEMETSFVDTLRERALQVCTENW